ALQAQSMAARSAQAAQWPRVEQIIAGAAILKLQPDCCIEASLHGFYLRSGARPRGPVHEAAARARLSHVACGYGMLCGFSTEYAWRQDHGSRAHHLGPDGGAKLCAIGRICRARTDQRQGGGGSV